MRYLWLWLLLPLLTACGVGQDFPEDRWVEGPWPISKEWRTITFSEPLKINDEGIQILYLMVDGNQFKRRNIIGSEDMSDQEAEQMLLVEHKQEGWLLDPDVIAVGVDGTEASLAAGSDYGTREGPPLVGSGYYQAGDFYTPVWPESMATIKAIRLRSDRPFSLEAVRWNMNRHPDIHTCWGPCPTWFTALDKTLYEIESWFGMHDESRPEG